jgi:hypothetical protein
MQVAHRRFNAIVSGHILQDKGVVYGRVLAGLGQERVPQGVNASLPRLSHRSVLRLDPRGPNYPILWVTNSHRAAPFGETIQIGIAERRDTVTGEMELPERAAPSEKKQDSGCPAL